MRTGVRIGGADWEVNSCSYSFFLTGVACGGPGNPFKTRDLKPFLNRIIIGKHTYVGLDGFGIHSCFLRSRVRSSVWTYHFLPSFEHVQLAWSYGFGSRWYWKCIPCLQIYLVEMGIHWWFWPEKVTYETLVTREFTFGFYGFPISTISKRLTFRVLESVGFRKEELFLSCPPLSSE